MENKTATISQLRARKQHYKLRMFQKLQYILLFVVFVISIFFVVSTLTFTGRLAEGTRIYILRLQGLDLQHNICRLCGKQLEGPLVAPRRLAILALFLRLWVHRLFMAAIAQQQQISPSFL